MLLLILGVNVGTRLRLRPTLPKDARQPDEDPTQDGEDRRKDKDLRSKTIERRPGDPPHQRCRGSQPGKDKGRSENTHRDSNGGTVVEKDDFSNRVTTNLS